MKHLRIWVILLLLLTTTNAYAETNVVFTLEEGQILYKEIKQCRVDKKEIAFYEDHTRSVNKYIQGQITACEEAVKQSQPSFLDRLKSGLIFTGSGIIIGVLLVVVI